MISDAGSQSQPATTAHAPGAVTHRPDRDPAAPTSDARARPLVHSGVDVSHFISMHILGTVFPLSAGLLLYGWRALLTIFFVVSAAGLSLALWRRVGRRGRQ